MTALTQSRPMILALSFGMIVLVMLLLSYYSLSRFEQVNAQFREVVNVNVHRVALAQKMRVIARERSPLLFALVNTEDVFARDELINKFRELGGEFIGLRERLQDSDLSGPERLLLDEHRDKARINVPEQRRVISLVQEERTKEAMDLLVNTVSPAQVSTLVYLDDFIALENQLAGAAVDRAEQDYEETIRITSVLTVLGSLLVIGIAILVSLRFQHYIKELGDINEGLEDRVEERTGELEQLNRELVKIASHDALTGLPNRAAFQEQLSKQLHYARRHGNIMAVLFIDLDGFKGVNDTYGHDHGDELLRQVASRMGDCLRKEDTVARIGGDEFTILLTGLAAATDYEVVANRIIEILNRPFDVLTAQCLIGSSIGVSLFPEHAEDEESLMRFADEAMYQVKQQGKNAYRLYEALH